ncbi:hypothetical protein CYMTET_31475 [Cymbomonas tetramitiformis]|uniref:Uncharacterized protein n=1 Tax=Cymbomonas tetramitiformis TaxID=36881 RepID=A0AAE0FGQ5_9CHLO|nr:hypothetical protein CYMTET_31475 [Cymbomonas tetramitiformis]
MEIVLDLKRQVKTLADTVGKRGFTPRVDKPLIQNPRAVKTRFAAKPLPRGAIGGNQTRTKWPSTRGLDKLYPILWESRAIDNDDAEKFDALCILAGGKPKMISDFSACSFCVDDGECMTTAIFEYTQYVQAHEAQMGFNVGGASEGDVHMDAFAARVAAPLSAHGATAVAGRARRGDGA